MTLDLNLVSLEIWPQFRAGRSPEPAAFGVKVVLVEASTNLVTDTPPPPSWMWMFSERKLMTCLFLSVLYC